MGEPPASAQERFCLKASGMRMAKGVSEPLVVMPLACAWCPLSWCQELLWGDRDPHCHRAATAESSLLPKRVSLSRSKNLPSRLILDRAMQLTFRSYPPFWNTWVCHPGRPLLAAALHTMFMSLVRAVEGHSMAHDIVVLHDAQASRLLELHMQVRGGCWTGRCASDCTGGRLLRRSELLFQLCEAECLHHDAHIVQALDVHLRATARTRKEAAVSVCSCYSFIP